ncbi:hypothetical protein OROGR_033176 [Orobanche gracilis]
MNERRRYDEEKTLINLETEIVERQNGIFLTLLPDPYDRSCQNSWGTMSNRSLEKSNLIDLFHLPILLDKDNEGVECLVLDNVGKVKDVVQIFKSSSKVNNCICPDGLDSRASF